MNKPIKYAKKKEAWKKLMDTEYNKIVDTVKQYYNQWGKYDFTNKDDSRRMKTVVTVSVFSFLVFSLTNPSDHGFSYMDFPICDVHFVFLNSLVHTKDALVKELHFFVLMMSAFI